MERVKIVGRKETSFTSTDGKQINGVNYFFVKQADNVDGLVANKFFISSDLCTMLSVQPRVGQEVMVDYNSYGKPADFLPASDGEKILLPPSSKPTEKKG